MRLIKFRAWDKNKGRMIYSEEAKDSKNLLAVGLHGLPIAVDGDSFRESEVVGWNIDHYITLMQYTGLLDKNGKDIYEGDIVRINHPHDMTGDFTNALGDVFWWDEEGGWYHGNQSGRPPKRMWEYVEVVGNVYENPEKRASPMNESSIERVLILQDVLEDGTYLFRTEYGSLLTEQMVKDKVLGSMFDRINHKVKNIGQAKIRVLIEVSETKP